MKDNACNTEGVTIIIDIITYAMENISQISLSLKSLDYETKMKTKI